MTQPPPDWSSQQPPVGPPPYSQAPPPQFPAAPPAGAYPYGQPGAPVPPPGTFFDPQSGLFLPQGTQLASVGRRIGAFFLAIPLSIVTLGIGYLIWGLVIWNRGQTPTYQVLGMRCWRPETQKVAGFWWMALRNIIGRIVEGILSIITAVISLILFLTRPDRMCLHDLVGGTIVLSDPNKVLESQR